jgi:hypothetical protein
MRPAVIFDLDGTLGRYQSVDLARRGECLSSRNLGAGRPPGSGPGCLASAFHGGRAMLTAGLCPRRGKAGFGAEDVARHYPVLLEAITDSRDGGAYPAVSRRDGGGAESLAGDGFKPSASAPTNPSGAGRYRCCRRTGGARRLSKALVGADTLPVQEARSGSPIARRLRRAGGPVPARSPALSATATRTGKTAAGGAGVPVDALLLSGPGARTWRPWPPRRCCTASRTCPGWPCALLG